MFKKTHWYCCIICSSEYIGRGAEFPKTYAFEKILTYYPFLYFTIATNATSATMCATSISMKFAKWTAI